MLVHLPRTTRAEVREGPMSSQASGVPPAGQGYENGMTRGEARTYRLAVGLFSEFPPLGRVLSDLSGHGMTLQCLCLIGLAEVLSATRGSRDLDSDLAMFRALFDQVEHLDGLFAGSPCVASAGPLLRELKAPAPLYAKDELGPWWLPKAQFHRVHGHVQDGGLVLIVSSGTSTEQDRSCRILLKHSRHGVQTHDITLRLGAGTEGNA